MANKSIDCDLITDLPNYLPAQNLSNFPLLMISSQSNIIVTNQGTKSILNFKLHSGLHEKFPSLRSQQLLVLNQQFQRHAIN